MSHAARHLVTEAEYLALPESAESVELIDGELAVSPSPSFWHQETLRRLVTQLSNWADNLDRSVTVGMAPLDVRFAPNRILQPDLFVLLGTLAKDHEGPLDAVPELCVEVLSTNRLHDRVTKRLIYAAAGVKELWTVERAQFIECWTGDALENVRAESERLTSPVLDGFELDVQAVFAD